MSELPLPPAFRPLGKSDIAVSPIAWGMWRLADNGRSAAEAATLVHAALDAGINFFDTASGPTGIRQVVHSSPTSAPALSIQIAGWTMPGWSCLTRAMAICGGSRARKAASPRVRSSMQAGLRC